MPNDPPKSLASSLDPREVEPLKHNFFWSNQDEPHALRRSRILAAHPEIRSLKGPSVKTFFFASFLIVGQLILARASSTMSLWLLAPALYLFGATANHSLSLANHELSHGLCFRSRYANRAFAFLCNVPMLVPTVVSFRYYHLRHHTSQGVDGVDVDVPSVLEAQIFRGALGKFIWLSLQPFMYGLRPLIVSPHSMCLEELLNVLFIASTDALIAYHWGLSAILYLALSSLIGHGLHPCAGHFIAEHYIIAQNPSQETYSYYGILNYVTFFVGYHNEHHDFPDIAGWNLPKVRALAPEFYDNLESYDSWVGVLYNFLFDPKVTLYSRVIRKERSAALGASKAAVSGQKAD